MEEGLGKYMYALCVPILLTSFCKNTSSEKICKLVIFNCDITKPVQEQKSNSVIIQHKKYNH